MTALEGRGDPVYAPVHLKRRGAHDGGQVGPSTPCRAGTQRGAPPSGARPAMMPAAIRQRRMVAVRFTVKVISVPSLTVAW